MKFRVVALLGLLILPACASIIEGTSQEITVNTNPSEADCVLKRQDIAIGSVNPTPGAVTIKKTKYDITIVCNKDGYQEATYLNHSGAAGATWGNIVAGGLMGWGIDSASGADNKYDSPVNISLVPEQEDEDDEDDAPKHPHKKTHHKKHREDDDDDDDDR